MIYEGPVFSLWGFSFDNLTLNGILTIKGQVGTVDFYGDTHNLGNHYDADSNLALHGIANGKYIIIDIWNTKRIVNHIDGKSDTKLTYQVEFNSYFISSEPIDFSNKINKIEFYSDILSFWLPPIADFYSFGSLNLPVDPKIRKTYWFDKSDDFKVNLFLNVSSKIMENTVSQNYCLTKSFKETFSINQFHSERKIADVFFSILTQKSIIFKTNRIQFNFNLVEHHYLKSLDNEREDRFYFQNSLKITDWVDYLEKSPDFIKKFRVFFIKKYPELLASYWYTILQVDLLVEFSFAYYHSWFERLTKDFFEPDKSKNNLFNERLGEIKRQLSDSDRKWLKENVVITANSKNKFFGNFSSFIGFDIQFNDGNSVLPVLRDLRNNFTHMDLSSQQSNPINFWEAKSLMKVYLDCLILLMCDLNKDSIFEFAKKYIGEHPLLPAYNIRRL